MKKTLCLLLALLMLLLTACQTTPEAGSDKSQKTESEPVKETPWSELKTLLENVDPMLEMAPIFQKMMGMSNSISGSGTFSMVAQMPAITEQANQEMNGTITIDGSKTKMEYTQDLMGVALPVINWINGDASYIQYPSLYPDKVFNAQEVSSSSPMGVASSPIVGMGVELSALSKQLISILEEVASPEKDMTVTESDGVFTYTLAMDAETGKVLFAEFDAVLESIGLSGLLNIGDLLGQLGGTEGTDKKEEITFDSAVFTVTTDKIETLDYCLQKLQGKAVVESLLLNTLATENSMTYKVEKKTGETVDLDLSVTTTESGMTMKGKINAEGSAIDLDLTITAASETAMTIEGTLTINMSQGGLSLAIPLTISGTVSLTDEKLELQLGIGMDMMGMSMNIEMAYDITLGDVELEFPFGEEDVLPFDEEDFYNRLLEVYPELNEDDSFDEF